MRFQRLVLSERLDICNSPGLALLGSIRVDNKREFQKPGASVRQAPILPILNAVHQSFNISQPQLGTDYWLCVITSLPYIIILGIMDELTKTPTPDNCTEEQPCHLQVGILSSLELMNLLN